MISYQQCGRERELFVVSLQNVEPKNADQKEKEKQGRGAREKKLVEVHLLEAAC